MTSDDKPAVAVQAGDEAVPETRFLPKEVDNLVGKPIGNYVISSFLGQGGMGTVFVAEHPSLGRKVAVKFLSRALATLPEMATRFAEEARTATSLRHPNIVDIFDFGELDGRPYYIMELLEGRDLGAVIAEHGRFSLDDVVEYVAQICAGLRLAHERGVVHRDLKPPNVFVLAGDPVRIKLTDFGIAKVLDNQGMHTQSGQILGTPSHMAPEQVLGSVRDISPRTDLYALGVILYEMLAGRPLFQHESPAMVMFMHLREPIVPLQKLVPDIPDGVALIVERCLAKTPADRPASAEEVLRAFVESAAVRTGHERTDDALAPMPLSPPGAPTPPPAPPAAAARTLISPGNTPVPPAAPVRAGSPSPTPAAAAAPVTGGALGASPAVRGSFDAAPVTGGALAVPPARGAPAAPAMRVSPVVVPHVRGPAAPAARPVAPAQRPSPAAMPVVPVAPAAAPVVHEGPPTLLDKGSPPPPPTADLSEHEQAALTRLLTRMQNKGDFPAFMKNVADVSRKADAAGAASATQLGDAILRDYSLTAKLLRAVNSSYYDRIGRKITKVSRAVVVLGFEQVRAIALSVAIHKNPDNKAHAQELAELSFNSLVSGEIARNVAIAAGLHDGEEAMVCAMFRNLGHHLVVYYLPEDYDKILKLVEEHKVTLDVAAEKVLGVSFHKVGTGIVQKWRLSPRISASMLPPNCDVRPYQIEDTLRVVSAFSNELSETVSRTPVEQGERAVQALLARYQKALLIPPSDVSKLFGVVQESFQTKYSSLLGLDPEKSRFFRNAGQIGPALMGEDKSAQGKGSPGGAPKKVPRVRPSGDLSESQAEELEVQLSSLETMRDGAHPADELVLLALQTFAATFGFRRALLLGRETSMLRVEAAWGEDAKMLRDELTIPLNSSFSADIFSGAFHTVKDAVVLDAFDDKISPRVFRGYYEMLGSPVFVLYPYVSRGATKILFADADSPKVVPKPNSMPAVQRIRAILAGEPTSPAPKEVRAFVPKRLPR